MMAIKFNFLIIYIFFECVINCAGFAYPELKLLNVVFRHGDREPNDETNGDLTIIGRRRAYHLGEMLRSRYDEFLGDTYEPSIISSHSTEFTRAKISLQLLLAALYVPQKHQKWHKSLAWQPIPFSYVSREKDVLLFTKYCPRFKREIERVSSMPEFQKLFEPFQDMLSNLTVSVGKEMKTSLDMFLLYHNLLAIKSMNQSIPEWAEPYFSNGLLLNGTYLEYHLLKYTDWMRKINGGALIRKVVDDMISKTNDTSKDERKVILYSTHELSIVAVLQTLKVWEPHIPEYSSAIVIELREDRSNYYVKILYYMGTPETFKEMQIPGCLSLCPLPRFIELISDQLPDYDEIICDDKPVGYWASREDLFK